MGNQKEESIYSKNNKRIKRVMQKEKENNKNTSLVPVNSKGLVLLENTFAITAKILEEQKDRIYILNWDLLIDYKDFFNMFFSTLYSFSENELMEYYGKLELGHEFSRPEIDSEPLGVGQAQYGLKYNRNVFWSESLQLLYSNQSNIFSFYYIENFEELPLDIKKQVDSHHFFEEEQFNYHRYTQNYENNPKLDKYYDDILNKKEYTNLELLAIIKNYITDYFCNTNFVKILKNKIKEDIKDFTISKLYSLISKKTY